MVMMIPKQSYFFDSILVTLYFFFLVSFVVQTLASPTVHHCRHDQRDALLEFKHEFPVNESYSTPFNMSSWNKSNDCCSWDCIACDAKYGVVISLYLRNVFLNNTLKPNSGLFKLRYLQHLTLSSCNLNGKIPSSLGNLSHLTDLVLSDNEFVGQIPASVRNLTQLSVLRLSNNKLSGQFPVSVVNLTELTELHLDYNYFKSEVIADISRLQNLKYFSMSGNSLFGHVPEPLFKCLSLLGLDLSDNNFIGPIPGSISQLVKLSYLDLSNNKLEGKVPSCLWRLKVLDLSQNSFSHFGKSSDVVGRAQMYVLRLDSNMFRGPFPQSICKFRLISIIDLSNNSFSGSLPQCLRNMNMFLQMLNLQNNNFSGILPDVFVNATGLNTFDVSRNHLEGKLPKSLIYCKNVRFLNVENNNFRDKFPSWLGSLPMLNVLSLRSNQFYGPLYHRQDSIGFQSLKVIDVSHNEFNGTLPALYFFYWQGMTNLNTGDEDVYMNHFIAYQDLIMNSSDSYHNSLEMVHKGVDRQFEWIRGDYIAIDFSGNKFHGKIPESIGLLKGLRHLNLSSNAFTSNMPGSLANLTKLEALDLSQNQLTGQIPHDLGILSSLSTINFSHNNLEGPLPRSTQFQRQNCTSFMGNPKLYGLEEICGKTHVMNPTPQESEAFFEPEEEVINWIAAAIAYGPGVFCGLVIGYIFVSHKHEWLMEKFHSIMQKVVIRKVH